MCVHFRQAGMGPAVICIHASASSSGQWRPLMDRLAPRFRTVAVDLYGSGPSPMWPGDRPLSLADEVELLAPVFASAGDRFHLVGHSYGGAVALRAALAHPGRVESLIVFEPVLFSLLFAEDRSQPAAREIEAVRDDTVAAMASGNPDASGARFVDYWMGAGTWARMPEPRREAVGAAMRAVTAQWHAAFMEPTPLSTFSAMDVPVLFIVGSESPASSRAVGRLLVDSLPRVTEVEPGRSASRQDRRGPRQPSVERWRRRKRSTRASRPHPPSEWATIAKCSQPTCATYVPHARW